METGKKYKLTDECIIIGNRQLYRIEALKDFGDVHKGDKGGYVENEYGLSHFGDCWVYDNAMVYGNSWVCDGTKICDTAVVCDHAIVLNDAKVYGNAKVFGNADVCGEGRVHGNTEVC